MNEQPYKWMTIKDNFLIIDVKVIPNSSKNSISNEGEFLKIKLTAPPVDNKANKALIEYLAKISGVSKSSIILKSGASSKTKRFLLPISAKEILMSL